MARRALPTVAALLLLATGCGGSSHPATISASAAMRSPCFGAASRDPQRPCHDPKLAAVVVPTPAVAAATGNAACSPTIRDDLVSVCRFGALASHSIGTIALIGDSHAAVWRASIAPVATVKEWHGLSITRAGCPLSTLSHRIGRHAQADCMRWQHEVVAWLKRHPEITIVFTTALSSAPFATRRGDASLDDTVAGYQRMWRALPKTVQHIVVIRDTPKLGHDNLDCVRTALAAQRQPAATCAVARSVALVPDPQSVAEQRLGSPRVQLIDATDLMCDERRCYPVVGGALVLKDLTHLSRVFATTLTPYVLRQVSRLQRGWG